MKNKCQTEDKFIISIEKFVYQENKSLFDIKDLSCLQFDISMNITISPSGRFFSDALPINLTLLATYRTSYCFLVHIENSCAMQYIFLGLTISYLSSQMYKDVI